MRRINNPLRLSGLLLLLGWGCSDYTPKPKGFYHITLPEATYAEQESFSGFSFEVSDQVVTENLRDSAQIEWFDLDYPSLNARIHCTYLPVTPENFSRMEEESRNFVYFHIRKAGAFREQTFENIPERVYGSLYEINGNVISPVQFVLTDSVSAIFRGALYFREIPDQDSIVPVLNYINQDIQLLIESFRWKR